MDLNQIGRRWILGSRRGIFLFALLLLVTLVTGACVVPAASRPAAPAPAVTTAPAAEPAPTEAPEAEAAIMGDPLNGQYIATLTGGCGCHFNRELGALVGGNKFERPFGVVHASNITPDKETGIGNWSEAEIAHVLRTGARPDGSQLTPAMPYRMFSVMSEKEAHDLAAYLLSLEPVANAVPEREINADPQPFTPAQTMAEPPTDPVARGQQLVTLANCGRCHTPAKEDGTPDQEKFLAGAVGTDEVAYNITPDEETGIGKWSQEEIANLLLTGALPNGGEAGGSMAQQIDRRFNKLTEADAMAIAAFLKSIPAVNHDPTQQ
jgi:mono/diheme cytochrome c family protein